MENNIVNIDKLAAQWAVGPELLHNLAVKLLNETSFEGEVSEFPDQNGHYLLELTGETDIQDFESELRLILNDRAEE